MYTNNILSPGNNFYEFVNNAWLTNPLNKIPEDYSSWGGFTKLYDDGLSNQINIVKDLEDKYSTEEEKKIFSIWKASEKRFQSWNDGSSNCDPIISEMEIFNNHFNFLLNLFLQNYYQFFQNFCIRFILNI